MPVSLVLSKMLKSRMSSFRARLPQPVPTVMPPVLLRWPRVPATALQAAATKLLSAVTTTPPVFSVATLTAVPQPPSPAAITPVPFPVKAVPPVFSPMITARPAFPTAITSERLPAVTMLAASVHTTPAWPVPFRTATMPVPSPVTAPVPLPPVGTIH